MVGNKRPLAQRPHRRSLSLSGLLCFSTPRVLDDQKDGVSQLESRRAIMPARAADGGHGTAARRSGPPPSLVLENYLGRGKVAGDFEVAESTVAGSCKNSELVLGVGCSECGAGPCSEAGEPRAAPGQCATSDDATSLSGPHTPDGRPAQAKPSIASTPDLAASTSSVDEGGPLPAAASSHGRSLSIPTPPDSPTWRHDTREFSLGRKLNVLRSLPAVVVLAEDPESPIPLDTDDRAGSAAVQRKLSQVVAGHHVHFTKIRRQMGNPNAPPDDLLALMARRVFSKQNCSFNQVNSLGEMSDLAAENSMPTPSSGQQQQRQQLAAAVVTTVTSGLVQDEVPVGVHTSSLSCTLPTLPPIRTRLPERHLTSPLA